MDRLRRLQKANLPSSASAQTLQPDRSQLQPARASSPDLQQVSKRLRCALPTPFESPTRAYAGSLSNSSPRRDLLRRGSERLRQTCPKATLRSAALPPILRPPARAASCARWADLCRSTTPGFESRMSARLDCFGCEPPPSSPKTGFA